MLLSDLKKGQSATIYHIMDFDIEIKLMDMGCLIGSQIIVELIAPRYDPIAISIGNYMICIGKEEAKRIEVSQ